jgi:WD40 repeat protein
VVTASGDKTAQVWDAATGKALGKPMKHKGKVYFAQFSPDGERVVTASEDKTARLWNALTGEQIGLMSMNRKSIPRSSVPRFWDDCLGQKLARDDEFKVPC